VAIGFVLSCGCGGSGATQIDASVVDAPAGSFLLEVADDSRNQTGFTPLRDGDSLPVLDGFQGFRLAALRFRAPADVASGDILVVQLSVGARPPVEQRTALPLEPPAGASRESDRYSFYLTQFTWPDLEGTAARLTATLDDGARSGHLELGLTIQRSSCVDLGGRSACPDAGGL
jgi:hypothetical protein